MKMFIHLTRYIIVSLILVGCGGSPNPGPSSKLIDSNPLRTRIDQGENASIENSFASQEPIDRKANSDQQTEAKANGYDYTGVDFDGVDAEPDKLPSSSVNGSRYLRVPLLFGGFFALQALMTGSLPGGMLGKLFSGNSEKEKDEKQNEENSEEKTPETKKDQSEQEAGAQQNTGLMIDMQSPETQGSEPENFEQSEEGFEAPPYFIHHVRSLRQTRVPIIFSEGDDRLWNEDPLNRNDHSGSTYYFENRNFRIQSQQQREIYQ